MKVTWRTDDVVYWVSRFLGRVAASMFLRVRCLGFELAPPGPCLLLCNHISHFDPPLLVIGLRRRIDYMTMAALFRNRFFSWWLRTVGAFPVEHLVKDPRSVRVAVRRLRQGHLVGVFPEGGIRTGEQSVIGGASLPRSAAAIAQMGQCPVRICFILGSDRLYDWRVWCRRPTIYLVCGPELKLDPSLARRQSQHRLTLEIEEAFRALHRRLEEEGKITSEMIPRSAQERWAQ